MAAIPPTPVAALDYQRLATLLDTAAAEQQHLANSAGDPVSRYQASVNAELFGAARRCAQDHARSYPTALQRPSPSRPALEGGCRPATPKALR